MGKSFAWIHKDRIKPFYDKLKLVATQAYGSMAKPSFARIKDDVQSSYDRKTWIVYDGRGFWYELEMGDAC